MWCFEAPGHLIRPCRGPAAWCAHPCGIRGSGCQEPSTVLYKSIISALCLLLPSQWQTGIGPKMPFPSYLPRAAGLMELESSWGRLVRETEP